MKYITIIPARGKSKRFPRKNVYNLAGKPLIAHSIHCSKNCHLVSETYVSTDDEEIKRVSIESGAKVLDRPAELGGDYTTSVEVMTNAVETLIKNGVEFDYVILLQATNPLRPVNLLEDAISIIEEIKCDSLMTVNRCELKLGKIIDSKFLPWNYHYGQRSQDMDPLFYENGLLYISSKELLLQGRIVSKNMHPMIVDHIFGEVDIDTRDDMKFAEFIINNYKND